MCVCVCACSCLLVINLFDDLLTITDASLDIKWWMGKLCD